MNRRHLPLLLAAALAIPQVATAQESPRPVTSRIVVVGEGEASIAPDMALLTLAVLREADTAREALDAANAAMAEVIASMKEAGIEPRDLQTTGLQINPRHVYPQDGSGGQPRIAGYQVSNTLAVRVRDIEKLGTLIDKAVTLGVNQGGSIVFTNDDPAAATTEARKRAVRNAVERANTLAEAASVKLGPIIEMSEHSMIPPPMPYDGRAYRMEVAADASVPVEAGENVYRVQVTVTFELQQ